ncbi:MAG: hypothetical protein JWO57_4198, partial [Pseudonocardiales bacterium]|nr:hypothetical protein [Pseudonocardiales bacterium]
MAASYTAELSYSYRRNAAVMTAVDLTADTAAETAALSKVDALLADGATAFNQ